MNRARNLSEIRNMNINSNKEGYQKELMSKPSQRKQSIVLECYQNQRIRRKMTS